MATDILHSFLYFSRAARGWVPALSRAIQMPRLQTLTPTRSGKPKSHFELVSWNIDFASSQPSKRCLGLLEHILHSGAPDIICLQEVRLDVRASLLGNAEIREFFLVTDAEPKLEERPFSTMTLLLKKRFAYDASTYNPEESDKFSVGPVFRRSLPSATGRDALYVCLIPPYAQNPSLSIINVHLESRNAYIYRAQQLNQLANSLLEFGCRGGLIAGDFNATTEKDHNLIEANGLKDAWLSLHGDTEPDSPTWSVGRRQDSRYQPSRLDKIAMVGAVTQALLPFGGGYHVAEKAALRAALEHPVAVEFHQQHAVTSTRSSDSASADLPPYRYGQHTLVLQDGTVCPSYGEKQWTGTIDVTDTRRLFFWAFESRGDPVNDPIIIWMDGGPGGSSEFSLFNQMGACRLLNDSKTTEPNPWSWNNNATVIFLDQPAGVGFSSISEGGTLPSKDEDGAPDFQEFLNIFFRDVFPDRAHLPLHIAAASYGGHYGPVYIEHILESRRTGSPAAFWGNITSMILLNGALDFGGPMMGEYELLCKDENTKGILTAKACEGILAAQPQAERIWRQCEHSLDVNDCFKIVTYNAANISSYYEALEEKRSPYNVHQKCPAYPKCPDTAHGNFIQYVNQKEVKAALRFPESYVFSGINEDINNAYHDSGSAWVPTSPQLGRILDAYQTREVVDDGKRIGDIRVMALNGNLDYVINTHGNILQYERVIWSRMGEYRAAKWRNLEDEDVAGTGSWKGTGDGRLVFVALDGAGHTVPGDKPEPSFKIMQRWLHNGWRK
ncbi:hypothetical protein PWT90_00436 [Aphanocladium album]|nr:hypothetical protein PWT90_00436 [Aphanocladium album]